MNYFLGLFLVILMPTLSYADIFNFKCGLSGSIQQRIDDCGKLVEQFPQKIATYEQEVCSIAPEECQTQLEYQNNLKVRMLSAKIQGYKLVYVNAGQLDTDPFDPAVEFWQGPYGQIWSSPISNELRTTKMTGLSTTDLDNYCKKIKAFDGSNLKFSAPSINQFWNFWASEGWGITRRDSDPEEYWTSDVSKTGIGSDFETSYFSVDVISQVIFATEYYYLLPTNDGSGNFKKISTGENRHYGVRCVAM